MRVLWFVVAFCLCCCECLFVVGVAVVVLMCLFDCCSILFFVGLLEFVVSVLGLLCWVCWFAVWCVFGGWLCPFGLLFCWVPRPVADHLDVFWFVVLLLCFVVSVCALFIMCLMAVSFDAI